MKKFFSNNWISILFLFLLSFLFLSLSTPMYVRKDNSTKSKVARSMLVYLIKECAVQRAEGINDPKFKMPELSSYEFLPKNGNCFGDEQDFFIAKSNSLKKLATWKYNRITGDKTCLFNGRNTELHGCSKDGEWIK